MTSKEIEKEFKEIEKKLIKILKSATLKISDNDDEVKTKEQIKKHIEKVNEARVLFEKYETLARQIHGYDDDDDNLVLAKSEPESQAQMKLDERKTKPVSTENKEKSSQKKAFAKSENSRSL